jgi:Na+/H+ antiporter NhaD/arsenite permease-like protein
MLESVRQVVLFAGLFVVVRALEVNVVQPYDLVHRDLLGSRPILALTGLSAVLSNLVSNVPAVLLFRPLIEPMSWSRPSRIHHPRTNHIRRYVEANTC